MLNFFFKLTIICIVFFYHSFLYSKNSDFISLNKKGISNYFSALVSLNNDQHADSLKFFNSSKFLKESNQLYLKNYLFSLVLNGKVSKAINEVKIITKKSMINSFDTQLLLVIDSIKRNDYEQSIKDITNLKKYETRRSFETVISGALMEYAYLFANKEISSNSGSTFGDLSLINKAFQNCYLGKQNTEILFTNIIKSNNGDYSRYLFFYLNYLISQKDLKTVNDQIQNIEPLNTTLLLAQSKQWIDNKNFKRFEEIFSCKNSNDLIGEFFFLISNLYSSEGNLKKSNYYFNLSQYLNPKFKFNLTLLTENYFQSKDFDKAKKFLIKINKNDQIYGWYKIKKTAAIIREENTEKKSFDYLNSEFNKLKEPSLKVLYDMANISKSFEKYDLSIEHYSKVLSKLNSKSLIYADVLFRRGGSYERLGNEKEADKDLLKSLKVNPDDPNVLNYLAYSWLERNYKIDIAIEMLEKAYEQKPDSPYIIDSIGWAHYLLGNYEKAEVLMKKAVELMPYDPIVNDHYGDILWKLNRKIEANYFWRNVLTFEDTKRKSKEEIYYKLLKGPKKI